MRGCVAVAAVGAFGRGAYIRFVLSPSAIPVGAVRMFVVCAETVSEQAVHGRPAANVELEVGSELLRRALKRAKLEELLRLREG